MVRESIAALEDFDAGGAVEYERRGYVVPLHDDGQPPQSYLFVVGRSRAEDAGLHDLKKELAAFVVGVGAPWRDGEDMQVFELRRDDLALLPKNMLLRKRIATADWSQPEPDLVPRELVLNTGRGIVVVRKDVPKRRKVGSWYPEGPIWRGARTLILVDLDEHNLGLAEAATRFALGDWWTASGHSLTYEYGRRGWAEEWDATQGRFRSPDETWQRVEQERSSAADRVGRQHYRASALFNRKERGSVRTALRARAHRADRTRGAEWHAMRRTTLRDVLAAAMPNHLDEFYRLLALSPAGPKRAAEQGFPALLSRFISTARRKLHEATTYQLLGSAWRQRWFGGRRRPTRRTERRMEDFVIERMDRERLIQDLTAVEVDLLEAREHRIPLTEWAADRKMPLSEARRLWADLRVRLRRTIS